MSPLLTALVFTARETLLHQFLLDPEGLKTEVIEVNSAVLGALLTTGVLVWLALRQTLRSEKEAFRSSVPLLISTAPSDRTEDLGNRAWLALYGKDA